MTGETGYQTGNVAIATMLRTLGVGWWKNDNDVEIPCFCQYDLEMLNKLARTELPQLKNMDIVEAAKLAHSKGKKGNVKYNFERSELLNTLINSWNKHEAWMDKQQKMANGANETTLDFPDIDPGSAARLMCQWTKNRVMISNLWKHITPDVVVWGKSKSGVEHYPDPKTGEIRERHTKTGSLRIMSVNASEETRKRLKI